MPYLFTVTLSSCIIAYFVAIPFYLLVERPFKNFLDLVLFPKSSIFKRTKDIDDDDEEEEEEETLNEDQILSQEPGGPIEAEVDENNVDKLKIESKEGSSPKRSDK